jgi:hypothetical protein
VTRSFSNVANLLMPLLLDHWLADHPESQLQIRAGEASMKSARRRSRRTRRRQVPENASNYR